MGIEKMIQICEFTGKKGESPKRHIESLERLFVCQNMDENTKLAIACSNVREDALDWWDFLESKPTNFEEYKQMILEGFWGEEHQEGVKQDVERVSWDGKESLSKFMRRQIARIRHLNAYVMSEHQIIRIAGKSLPGDVRHIMDGVRNIKQAMRVLDAIENDLQAAEEIEDIRVANLKWDIEEIKPECPVIDVCLEGVWVKALLDSGSQVSVMSAEVFDQLKNCQKKLRLLPTKRIQVILANGKKTKVETQQVYAEIGIGEKQYHQVMLVLQGLIHDVILGSDFMYSVGCIIDFKAKQALIGEAIILFRKQQVEKREIEQQLQSLNLERNSVENIKDKVEINSQDIELINGIKEAFRDVFSDIPGKIPNYEHRIVLTDQDPYQTRTYPVLVLTDQDPYQTRTYPVPFQHRDKVEEQIGKMMKW